jgi:hypothetical protein
MFSIGECYSKKCRDHSWPNVLYAQEYVATYFCFKMDFFNETVESVSQQE